MNNYYIITEEQRTRWLASLEGFHPCDAPDTVATREELASLKRAPRPNASYGEAEGEAFTDGYFTRDEEAGQQVIEYQKALAALREIKIRLHFMGWPAESYFNGGTEEKPWWVVDWRYEIDMLENVLHGSERRYTERPRDNTPYNQIEAFKPVAKVCLRSESYGHGLMTGLQVQHKEGVEFPIGTALYTNCRAAENADLTLPEKSR